MRADLAWSYTQAGAMNTANAVGYLAGALAGATLIGRCGERRSFGVAFAMTAGTVAASGLTTGYSVLLAMRAATGAVTAVLFLAGATLAARLAGQSPSPGLVLGIYFAGVGPGIGVSALVAPMALSADDGWRTGWLLMGATAAAAAVVARRASRAVPTASGPAVSGQTHCGSLRWAFAAFALFGLGYIAYMTFIVAYYEEAGRTTAQITLFWGMLAVAATCSGWAWRRLLDRNGGGGTLAIMLALAGLGASLPLAVDAPSAMVLSAVLFGGTFLTVIAAVSQLVRRAFPPHRLGFGLAVSTNLFAGAQTVGPVLTGALADRSGDLRGGLAASSGLLVLAAAAAALQRRPEPASMRPADAAECPGGQTRPTIATSSQPHGGAPRERGMHVVRSPRDGRTPYK